MFFSVGSRSYQEHIPVAPAPRIAMPRPRIGVVLGGGSARGWAHIGVLRELVENGIVPDVVTGTSIGALVGACYAAGKLDKLEAFARGLNRRRMLRLLDVSLAGTGMIAGSRLKRRLDRDLQGVAIEDLHTTFAAVATELGTGREICLSRGDLVESIRASYALPGIFQPVFLAGRWLFDGTMSNPVPVSVARTLGADFTIAVHLNGGLGEGDMESIEASGAELDDLAGAIDVAPGRAKTSGLAKNSRFAALRRLLFARRSKGPPGMASIMIDAFSISQERIARSRLEMDAPDVMINARLNAVGLFDFHRATELIAHGRLMARRAMPQIEAQLMHVGRQRAEH